MVGSCSNRPRIGIDASAVFGKYFFDFGVPVAPRIVNDVSYVTRIDDASHFAWQGQHLVRLEGHFSWQAQYSVKFE